MQGKVYAWPGQDNLCIGLKHLLRFGVTATCCYWTFRGRNNDDVIAFTSGGVPTE